MKSSTFSFRAWPLVFALAAAAAAPACGDAEEASTSTGTGGDNNNGGTTGEGLPCDVAQVLASKCWSCHGAKPAGGAPMGLVSYDQLVKPSITDPNTTNVALCVIRMKAMNMPPAGGATAEEIGVLEAWIAAGTPKGTCGTTTDPFGGAVVCTSGKTWVYGEDVSDPMRLQMHPGGACITCHSKQPPPDVPAPLAIGGTVYPTGHEPDECYGIDGTVMTDVKVHIEDSAGNVYDLPVNATGNFLFFEGDGPFVPPYTAKVVSSKGERAMGAPQTSGDCNSCHTVDGNGAGSMAPGRIVMP